MSEHRGSSVAAWLRAARGVHEWPLVAFTGLAVPASGVFAARLVAGASRVTPALQLFSTLALLVGLAISLAHLGRPLRAPLALRAAGRSVLTAEILLAVALLAVTSLAWLPHLSDDTSRLLDITASVLALGLLATFGLVYFLPARWPWHSTLVATPLTAGLAAGIVLLAAARGLDPIPAAIVALLADAVVFAAAWSFRGTRSLSAVHPAIFARRRALVALRLAMLDCVPAALLAVRQPVAAAVVVLAGVLVDRFTFYGAAAVRSTEGEIARIEAFLESRVAGPPPEQPPVGSGLYSPW